MSKLHPDFPEAEGHGEYWAMPDPLSDIAAALNVAEGNATLDDLATVTHYVIDSNNGRWEPGGSTGTELSMFLLGTLKDGRHFGLEAFNDYTGWGCGEGADLYVGDTREDVIANGLTTEARNALGVSL